MATETQVRKKIRCWKCGRIFTLLIDAAGEPELSLTCPFCGASLHIDLAQFPTTVTSVLRNGAESKPTEITVFVLPDLIETQAPESP